MRLTLIGALAISLTGAVAHASQIQRIELVGYGIYTSIPQSCQRDTLGVNRCTVRDVRQITTTSIVPFRTGVEFGVEFKTIGSFDATAAEVRKVWIFPGAGLKSPFFNQPLRRDEEVISVPIGTGGFVAYTLDEPWELVPGIWTVEIWDGNRRLLSKSFTVVKR